MQTSVEIMPKGIFLQGSVGTAGSDPSQTISLTSHLVKNNSPCDIISDFSAKLFETSRRTLSNLLCWAVNNPCTQQEHVQSKLHLHVLLQIARGCYNNCISFFKKKEKKKPRGKLHHFPEQVVKAPHKGEVPSDVLSITKIKLTFNMAITRQAAKLQLVLCKQVFKL